MTTRSTSASAASALRSGASPANRAAVALERTISESMPDKRHRDGVGQAEREKVGVGIGPQNAERQHDDARQRLGHATASVPCTPCTPRSSAAISSAEAGRSAGRLASARRMTRSTAATPASR